jgi:DMSO/TMAO reductase YedYZ molybdopterin-dependent catalytic subunit
MKIRLLRTGIGALIGLLAAAMAIGAGELSAAFVRPSASPIVAVGNKFILLTPESLKEYAIRQFGSHDKDALLAGIYAAVFVFALVVGALAMWRAIIGVLGLLAFGGVGVFSALTANSSRGCDVIPTIVATIVGLLVLNVLLSAATGRSLRPGIAVGDSDRFTPGRRAFLLATASTAAVAGLAAVGGRALQHARFDASRSRAAVRLPAPADPAPALPPGVDLGKSGMPFLTPTKDFYRVDTAISVPQLNAQSWRLRIHGRVEHPRTLTFDDLLERPLIERYITMTCVSNEVGGPYLSTAKFLGVPLAPLLREAGVRPGADQIVGRSSDGMTIGTPTSVIMNTPDAMLALGMNGEPLPIEHGFPVRMLVPGLYGYVSATKWLVDLEATTFAAAKTYWVQRGWVAKAPIRLESRIDTPKAFARVAAGKLTAIAGVAWHQGVGISQVEVRVDDGPWQPAKLGRVPSSQTWVQWVLPWTPATTGSHTISVRATDSNGVLQDQARRASFPSGASGWQSLLVQAG